MDFEKLSAMAKEIAKQKPTGTNTQVGDMNMEDMFQHTTKIVLDMMKDGKLDPSQFMTGMPSMTAPEIDKSEDAEDSDDEDGLLPKTKNLNYDLSVTLKELYTGKKKKISVKTKKYKTTKDVDGHEKVKYFEDKKKLVIPIDRGLPDEHTIVFEGEADQKVGHRSGDIVISVREEEHPDFERIGDHLLYKHDIDISLAECFGLNVNIDFIDGRKLCLVSTEPVHTKNGIRKIPGYGMPIYSEETSDEPIKFGDLFIKFNTVTPEKIDKKHLEILKEIFPPINQVDSEDNRCVLKELTETDYNNLYEYGGEESSDDEEDDEDESEGSEDDEESEESEE